MKCIIRHDEGPYLTLWSAKEFIYLLTHLSIYSLIHTEHLVMILFCLFKLLVCIKLKWSKTVSHKLLDVQPLHWADFLKRAAHWLLIGSITIVRQLINCISFTVLHLSICFCFQQMKCFNQYSPHSAAWRTLSGLSSINHIMEAVTKVTPGQDKMFKPRKSQ